MVKACHTKKELEKMTASEKAISFLNGLDYLAEKGALTGKSKLLVN